MAEPLSFGVSVSRLVEMIDTRHEGVEMTEAERARLDLTPIERRIITTWIDLNCPPWESYDPDAHVAIDSP